jgi:multiple sugar transport system permease protein
LATTQRSRRETLGSEGFREALVGYAFIAVPMFVFVTFFIFPMAYAFYISYFEWGIRGKIESVGFENYSDLFEDERFRTALWNTIYYTIGVVPAQMALGLLMAVVVNQAIRFRTFFRAAYYFPSIASSAAITAIALYIFNVDGIFNRVLGSFGLPDKQAWFGEPDTALETIMGLNAWTTSGTMMLFYLAGLQAISTDVYEAAAIDGAGHWRTFWKVTFPLLKPAHYFVAVVSVIGALKVFDQAYIVSRGTGGPANSTLTAVLYLFRSAIRDGAFGYAAAAGVVLFCIIFIFTLVQRQLFGRTEAA